MGVAVQIQVLAPVVLKKLGYYKGITGVFVIRQKEQVLYVGWSTDIHGTCTRYFCKNGYLAAYDIKTVNFELIITQNRKARKLTKILKQELQPIHNEKRLPTRLNSYEHAQYQRFYKKYCSDSFFIENLGEAKSDT